MRKAWFILVSALVIAGCGHAASGDPTLDITDAERDARIAIDFSRDRDYIVEYLKPYYPELTDEQMAAWEASKALECRMIDGQKRYFRSHAKRFMGAWRHLRSEPGFDGSKESRIQPSYRCLSGI